MKQLDPSFKVTPLDRLPNPRMDGVEFGFLRLGAGEHLVVEEKPWSWFFQVRRGTLEVRLENEPPIIVRQGSCVGIDGRKPFELMEISRRPGGTSRFRELAPWAAHSDQPLELLVGHAPLAANLLLASFWATVHLAHDYDGPAAQWVAQLTDLIVLELSADQEKVDRAGILQRLAELIVIVLVRHMSEEAALIRENLPTALHDPRIWRALAAFQRAPDAAWTVEGLARVAGMSRTGFAVRFQELLGQPPLHCLAKLRMDMAADMLAQENVPVKTIAERVGYGTEAAFNRAFVRHYGTSPGRWRQRQRHEAN